MKKINLIRLLMFTMVILINIDCKKEIQPAPVNTAPIVKAGNNTLVVLPFDSCILSGSAWDKESNIKSYRWEKTSVPLSYTFENQDSLSTKVKNLRTGDYTFELTVTDKEGLTGKATTTVTVMESTVNPNEIIFHDLKLSCPMGCLLEIKNIYHYVPGNVLSVYVRRKSESAIWIKALADSPWPTNYRYVYGVSNSNLWVYSETDENGILDIKIVY